MKSLILILLISSLAGTVLFGQQQFSVKDSVDFISPSHVYLKLKGTSNTMKAHSLSVQDLMDRVTPIDTSWMDGVYDGAAHCILYYDDSYITIYADDTLSNFRLRDSTTFEVVLYGSLNLQVGDDIQKARDIFPQAAKREITNSPHGANGMYMPYSIKQGDGKDYISDSALHINYDISTDKITLILSTNNR